MTSRQQNIFLLAVFILVVFRTTISIFMGAIVADGSLLVLMILALLLFAVRLVFFRFHKRELALYFFVFWCLILLFLYGLTSEVGNYYVPVIGFFNICGLLIFFMVVYSYSRDRLLIFCQIKRIIVVFCLVNALGAIFQFFVSDNLFGLTSNSIYADSEVLSNVNVERRAISFISSPQSLSLFLAFGFVIGLSVIQEKFYRIFYLAIVFFAGALTVSKAFFVFLVAFFVFYNMSLRRFLNIFLLFFLVFLFFSIVPEGGKFSRVLQLAYFFENYEQYSAYVIWMDSIKYIDDTVNLIVGKGLGVFSRGGQVIADYEILHGSTESYFIQLYVEIGVIGLLSFFVLAIWSYFRLLFIDKTTACALVAICAVGLFTPAPYGFVCGLLMHFCIASGLLLRSEITSNPKAY